MMAQKENEMRLQYLRKKKMIDEEAHCTEKPKINKYGFLDKNRISVYKRDVEEEDYDDILAKQRKNRPQKPEDLEENQNLRFSPEFIADHDLAAAHRTVDDLIEWEAQKRTKLANERLRRMEDKYYPFQPKIDKKSEKLTKKFINREQSVEDRLLQAGEKTKEKIEQLKVDSRRGMFKPGINLNSKKLSKMQRDALIKKENGSFLGVDYFEALSKPTEINRGIGSQSLLSKEMKRRLAEEIEAGRFGGQRGGSLERRRGSKSRRLRNGGRGTTKKERSVNDLAGSKTARELSKAKAFMRETADYRNLKTAVKEKNNAILPSYVSPYNKEMLGSGLPLKTIIQKSIKTKNGKVDPKARKRRRRKKIDYTQGSKTPHGTKPVQYRGPPTNSKSRSLRKKQKSRKKLNPKNQGLGAGGKRTKKLGGMSEVPLKTKHHTRFGKEKRRRLNAQKAQYATPEKGLRPPYYSVYDEGEYSPKKWLQMMKKRRESNSKIKLRNLIYKDSKSFDNFSSAKKRVPLSERKNRANRDAYMSPEKVGEGGLGEGGLGHSRGHRRHKGVSRTERKRRRGDFIEGYDDYKRRLKLMGNMYMFESIGQVKKGMLMKRRASGFDDKENVNRYSYNASGGAGGGENVAEGEIQARHLGGFR